MIEQSKEAYYLALRQTQGSIRTKAPDWQPWLLFFLRALAEQVRRLKRKVEREKLVLAALPELSLQIVEFAREHGRITMADAVRLTGGNHNTLTFSHKAKPAAMKATAPRPPVPAGSSQNAGCRSGCCP